MNYRVVEKNGVKYIEYISVERQISSERDVLDLVSICIENDVYIICQYKVWEDIYYC